MTLKDIIEDEREEARAEGFEKGREEGELKKACEMAKAMLQGGKLSVADVAAYSGLSEAEIKSFSL